MLHIEPWGSVEYLSMCLIIFGALYEVQTFWNCCSSFICDACVGSLRPVLPVYRTVRCHYFVRNNHFSLLHCGRLMRSKHLLSDKLSSMSLSINSFWLAFVVFCLYAQEKMDVQHFWCERAFLGCHWSPLLIIFSWSSNNHFNHDHSQSCLKHSEYSQSSFPSVKNCFSEKRALARHGSYVCH